MIKKKKIEIGEWYKVPGYERYKIRFFELEDSVEKKQNVNSVKIEDKYYGFEMYKIGNGLDDKLKTYIHEIRFGTLYYYDLFNNIKKPKRYLVSDIVEFLENEE